MPDKNREIEEMANIIDRNINGANFDDVNDAVCELRKEGYRKASDVIDELVEKLKNVHDILDVNGYRVLGVDLIEEYANEMKGEGAE